MMVTISEKLPFVRAGPGPAAQEPAMLPWRRRAWGIVSAVVVVALLGRLALHVHRPCHHGRHGGSHMPSSPTQCPQVNPLFPGSSSAALEEMDVHIASAAFREATVARMAGAIQVPTESFDDLPPVGEGEGDPRWDVFFELAAYLAQTFPLVYSTLRLEKVNTHGLLFTWAGSEAGLKPTVLMAHQDVVPVETSTVDQWTYPPFSGDSDGKHIWGRGSSDCKNNLIGILEAVELLIGAGFSPRRTLILSFGFDEEISGREGAGHLGAFLLERYGRDGVAMIVDEGSGIFNAFGADFALPAVAEKGYIDVEVIVRVPGGHSSIPPAHNGIGITAELVSAIEAAPYEPHLHDENPFLGLLECGAAHGPEFPPPLRKLLDRRRRHGDRSDGGRDELALEAAKAGLAVKYLFTTSVAPDIIGGGVKVNALPERTRLVVNHRVNVGDTSAVVREKLTGLAAGVAERHNLTLHAFPDSEWDGETPSSITLRASNHTLEPAPVTPTSVEGGGNTTTTPYAVLSGTTRALYGTGVLMGPGLSTGNTDTRYYWDLTRHIFRYGPGWDPEDGDAMNGVHTVDERISILAHVHTVQWFSLFVRNVDEAQLA